MKNASRYLGVKKQREKIDKIIALSKKYHNSVFIVSDSRSNKKFNFIIKDIIDIQEDFYQTPFGRLVKSYKVIYKNGEYNRYTNPVFSLHNDFIKYLNENNGLEDIIGF